MTVITAEQPKTTTKTFSHWWLSKIVGTTQNPSTTEQTFGMYFEFVRGNRDPDTGVWELSPFQEDQKVMTINDIFVFAAQEAANGNTQPAQIIESLLILAGSMAKTQGIID